MHLCRLDVGCCAEGMNNRREQSSAQRAERSTVSGSTAWIDEELASCEFGDARLQARFRKLLEQFSSTIGGSIPWVCQDWANAKAAYRFFSNDRVNEAEILAGHFSATRERFTAHTGPVLVLHDTTELIYHRDDPAAVGILSRSIAGKDKRGRLRHYTVCGISMHSSLVVSVEGLPLGLAAIKFWTRDKFYGANALKKRINPTRVPIEKKESIRWLQNLKQSTALLNDPGRCVHIGDRVRAIFTSFSVPPSRSARIFWCGPVSTV